VLGGLWLLCRMGRDAREHFGWFARAEGGKRLTDFQHDLLFLLHDLGGCCGSMPEQTRPCRGQTRAQWGILLGWKRQPGMSQKELSELL